MSDDEKTTIHADRSKNERPTASGNHDLTGAEIQRIGQGGSVYRRENGEYRSFLGIAMRGTKEGAEIVEIENGFLVDGELYECVAHGPSTLDSTGESGDDE
jgi:hypothetical protein